MQLIFLPAVLRVCAKLAGAWQSIFETIIPKLAWRLAGRSNNSKIIVP
jgi:hypothetical protein